MAGNDDGQAINFLNLQGLNAVQAGQLAELLGRGAAQGQMPQQQQQLQVQQLLQHHLQQQQLQNPASLAGGAPSFSPWLSAAAMNRLLPQPTAGILPSGGGAPGSAAAAPGSAAGAGANPVQLQAERKKMLRLVWQDPKEKGPTVAVTSFCGEMSYAHKSTQVWELVLMLTLQRVSIDIIALTRATSVVATTYLHTCSRSHCLSIRSCTRRGNRCELRLANTLTCLQTAVFGLPMLFCVRSCRRDECACTHPNTVPHCHARTTLTATWAASRTRHAWTWKRLSRHTSLIPLAPNLVRARVMWSKTCWW